MWVGGVATQNIHASGPEDAAYERLEWPVCGSYHPKAVPVPDPAPVLPIAPLLMASTALDAAENRARHSRPPGKVK